MLDMFILQNTFQTCIQSPILRYMLTDFFHQVSFCGWQAKVQPY